ncbi:MAG: hypothetical protein ACKOE6_15815, partial [Flammeovirgaceae bacterium]
MLNRMISRRMSFKPEVRNLFSVFFVLVALSARAQIVGQSNVVTGQTYTYTFQNGTKVYADPIWTVTNGTNLGETVNGALYTVQVTWNAATSGTLRFKNGNLTISTLNVTITALPATPNTTFTRTYSCGTTTVARSNNPPAGTDWYWQTINNGTSTALGSAASINLTAGTDLYLRARANTSPFSWSANSQYVGNITVYSALPAVPTGTTDYTICADNTVTISATPGSGGDQIRWYNFGTGGTQVGTDPSFTTPNLSFDAVYWASTVQGISGCESSTRMQAYITVTPK